MPVRGFLFTGYTPPDAFEWAAEMHLCAAGKGIVLVALIGLYQPAPRMNDPILLALVALLPSIIVFLTAFYLIRNFLGAQTAERIAARRADQAGEDRKHTLPLRLQAYERLTLFTERIEPGPLVLRVHKSNMSSRMLHAEVVATIREEFQHNVTQQLYVSDRAWAKVRQAKDETIRLMNVSYEQCGDSPSATDLSQRIFANVSHLTHTPSQEALLALREEVRKLF